MTLGTGIFLSALFLGTIFLFHTTKDRWSWAKGGKRLGLLVLGLCVLGSGYWAYDANKDKFLPKKPYEEFWGVKLGASMEDVIFLKGEPTNQYDASEDRDAVFIYSATPGKWMIFFNKQGEAMLIVQYAQGYEYSKLYGIGFGASVQKVLDTLGEPDEIVVRDDGKMRHYLYKSLNTRYGLEQGKVVGLAIMHTGD